MRQKKTTEQFKQEVCDLVGDEYTVQGTYTNSTTKIEMHHSKCDKDYLVIPNSFLHGNRCPYCASNAKRNGTPKRTKRTTEQYKQEVYDLVGDEYTVQGTYTNAKTKIEMHHSECDKDYLVMPNSFLHGNRCPYCAKKTKKTTEQFKQEVYDLVGDEYTVQGTYTNSKTKIEMHHSKCGGGLCSNAKFFFAWKSLPLLLWFFKKDNGTVQTRSL